MEISEPPPDTLTPELLASWWNLTQTMKRVVAPMLTREHGVDFKDFVALSAIESGAGYPGALCERMHLPPSHVSRLIDDLVKGGVVERQLDPHDSRRVRLHITPRGREVLAAAKGSMVELLDAGLEGLSPAQVQSFADTMNHIIERMNQATQLQPSPTPQEHA